MSNKVSVIIPNYNAGNYILKCIDSVINQTYKNIEIIIIDDGSTDNSWEIIKELESKYSNIVSIKQNNMNAAIARNKGIEVATGEYFLFLDSDDILFPDSISILVSNIENDKSDLCVGNFSSVSENEEFVYKYEVNKELKMKENNNYFLVPNPSNKLFKKDIIDKNNIYFGNVRIGQDLNFYIKYLLFAKKISYVNETIYAWRKVSTSMTNQSNFRFFDIVESIEDIKKFYKINNKLESYSNIINGLALEHYYYQMEKQIRFKVRRDRKLVVRYFKVNLKKVDLKNSLESKMLKRTYIKFKIKVFAEMVYISNMYKFISRERK